MFGRNSLALALAVAALGARSNVIMADDLARTNGYVLEPTWTRDTSFSNLPNLSTYRSGYARPGVSAAAIKRASKKARNVRRHKSHTKGA